MSKKQKNILIRIIAAGILLIIAALLPLEEKSLLRLAAFLVPYGIIGWDVLWKAIRNIKNGQIFDENFLMAVATVGALAVKEYPEATAVMLFYQIGELFQSVAVGKSRKNIASLMDIRPDHANIEVDGKLVEADPEEIEQGQLIVVKPGERIPLDGTVIDGTSSVDTSALTGESVPRTVRVGDSVISGCINQSGVLKVEVTKEYEDSTVAKILDLVENSASKKAKAENFITKFAKYYTPAVVISALLLALLPSLVTGGNWAMWIHRALIFLVISCPCALVISVPLSFFGGIGGASKKGILIKGGNFLEVLANAEIIVFDKTGTLTKGVFEVDEIHPHGIDEDKLLELAAYAESYSDHPIAHSISSKYGRETDRNRISSNEEISGHGIKAVIDDHEICAGNSKLMDKMGVEIVHCDKAGTMVHISDNGQYSGHIVIADKVKESAQSAIKRLKARGVKQTVMLTGDSSSAADAAMKELGLDKAYSELLPADKVEKVEQLPRGPRPR